MASQRNWLHIGTPGESERYIDLKRVSFARFYSERLDPMSSHARSSIRAVDLVVDGQLVTIKGDELAEVIRKAMQAVVGTVQKG